MINVNEQYKSIIIRNTRENDLEYVVSVEREYDNAQYVGQWSREQHEGSLSQDDILHLVVEDKASGRPVGYVIIAGLLNPNRNIEFRRVAITEKGKGYGRETLQLIKKLSFDRMNAHRLWLDVREKNERAQKLYKSEGFVIEGVLRSCVYYGGNYESLIVMSILKEEYMAMPAND